MISLFRTCNQAIERYDLDVGSVFLVALVSEIPHAISCLCQLMDVATIDHVWCQIGQNINIPWNFVRFWDCTTVLSSGSFAKAAQIVQCGFVAQIPS